MREYTEIAMVRADDSGYLRNGHRFAEQRRSKGPHDQLAAECSRLFDVFEEAVRQQFALHCPVREERILSFMHLTGQPARQIRTYREVDCVVGTDDQSRALVEMKTCTTSKLRTSTAQLNKTLEIARLRWPNTQGVWLDIALEHALKGSDPPDGVVGLEDVYLELDSRHDEPGLARLHVDGAQLVAAAQDSGLLPRDFLDRLSDAMEAWADPVGEWAATHNTGETTTPASV